MPLTYAHLCVLPQLLGVAVGEEQRLAEHAIAARLGHRHAALRAVGLRQCGHLRWAIASQNEVQVRCQVQE